MRLGVKTTGAMAIDDELDSDLEIRCTIDIKPDLTEFYINESDAIRIIEHLIEHLASVFGIDLGKL